jgi:hypothetical protein
MDLHEAVHMSMRLPSIPAGSMSAMSHRNVDAAPQAPTVPHQASAQLTKGGSSEPAARDRALYGVFADCDDGDDNEFARDISLLNLELLHGGKVGSDAIQPSASMIGNGADQGYPQLPTAPLTTPRSQMASYHPFTELAGREQERDSTAELHNGPVAAGPTPATGRTGFDSSLLADGELHSAARANRSQVCRFVR